MNNRNDIFKDFNYRRIQYLKGVTCCDHLHRSAEIAIVAKGSLIVRHEGETVAMKANEGMLIMPYELHSYRSDEECEAVIIEFNRFAFDELASMSGPGGIRFGLSGETVSYILHLSGEKSFSEAVLKAMVYAVLSELSGEHTAAGRTGQTGEIYLAALKFIDENFAEELTLRDVAEAIGCSYVHLSRVFSKTAGISFTAYLNRYRIANSATDLKRTDVSITEIAYKNGFGSLRNYNREFKKMFGMTPGEYRNEPE